MHQEIKRNDVPMFLASIGRWFLEVLVARVKFDASEVIVARCAAIAVNACLSNRFRECRRCRACRCIAFDLDSCVSGFCQSSDKMISLCADDVIDDGRHRSVYLQRVWVHSLTDDG